MKETWEMTSGSVIGHSHRKRGKNNQDALAWYIGPKMITAVVCDGCSAGAHSGVGAKIGAKLMMAELNRHVLALKKAKTPSDTVSTWRAIKHNILAQLRILVLNMGGSFSQTVHDYFLFTVLGFYLDKDKLITFSIGDGLIFINDSLIELGPFLGNQPPYLSYGLIEDLLYSSNRSYLRFNINFKNSSEVDSIIIGTDGVKDLIAVADKFIPGKDERVGPVKEYIERDIYYTNLDALRRRLDLINRDVNKIKRGGEGDIIEVNKENGLLFDDTTLVALRRKYIRWEVV